MRDMGPILKELEELRGTIYIQEKQIQSRDEQYDCLQQVFDLLLEENEELKERIKELKTFLASLEQDFY